MNPTPSHETTKPDPAAKRSGITPAIAVDGLGRAFGPKWAAHGLTFQVPRGAICGFLGLNGAGKTTVLRMLYGLIPPTAGAMRVAGLDPATDTIALRRRVGYVMDSPVFYDWLTARETLLFASHHRSPEWDQTYAMRLLDLFNVPPDQPLGSLSKGQRAKVSLVLGLAFRPEVLLLDEPTLGLDPVARRQFVEGVLGEFAGEGRTVMISSHQITEIAGLVDHLVVINESRLVAAEPTEALLSRVVRARLSYEGDAPATAPDADVWAAARLAHWSASGAEVEAMLTNYTPGRTDALRQTAGAHSIAIECVGLEDAFVHLVGGWREGARP